MSVPPRRPSRSTKVISSSPQRSRTCRTRSRTPDPLAWRDKARKYGLIGIARAYADFDQHPPQLRQRLNVAGFEAEHYPVKRYRDRDGTERIRSIADLHMVIDIVDTALGRPNIDTFLFFTGEITSARRNGAFERCYDLTERVLPPEVRATEPVADADAVRQLLEIGARAHGVVTLRCFKDYFRLAGPAVRVALAELVEAGTLRPVTVRGWDEPTYLHADAALPRRATAVTLLNPFDPLVFERTRLERLFDVHYRIEIYVPAAQRVHGYYVLPFLEGRA